MGQPDPPPDSTRVPAESPPPGTGRAATRQVRLEREAAALRDSLRRRKTQLRARADGTPPSPAGVTEPD